MIRWGEPAGSGEPAAGKPAWYRQAALVLAAFAVMLGAIFLTMQIG